MAHQIFVVNGNDFDHVDTYDGEEYVFPKGERVLIPYEAAVHFFGRDLPDKSETLVRLGWEMKDDTEKKQFVEDQEGVKKLARFQFEEAVMVSKSSLERKLAEKSQGVATRQ